MTNINLNTTDMQLLAGLAERLLWDGHDRAADAIYAVIEAAAPVPFTTSGNVVTLNFPGQVNAGQ